MWGAVPDVPPVGPWMYLGLSNACHWIVAAVLRSIRELSSDCAAEPLPCRRGTAASAESDYAEAPWMTTSP